jgi:hypothetical protein
MNRLIVPPDAIYELKLSAYPTEWLTKRFEWEGREFLMDVYSEVARAPWLNISPLSQPPWRMESPPHKPRPSVLVRLYGDESDDEHRHKLEAGAEEAKALRTSRPGPKPWGGQPPSDEERVRLLYLNLRGESYQKLANNHAKARGVHSKTLQDHLVVLRATLSGEQ